MQSERELRHELRNHLNTLLLTSSLLGEESTRAEMLETLDAIIQSSAAAEIAAIRLWKLDDEEAVLAEMRVGLGEIVHGGGRYQNL